MSTVGQLIDRLNREWLSPADQQPRQARLNGAISDSDTTATLTTTTLDPAEREVTPGTAIEVGLELMLVTDFTDSVVTVVRGHQGTTAAAHSDGDPVILSPRFPRLSAFDAVADEVMSLSPPLWGFASETLVGSTEPIDIDANYVGIAAVTWLDTNSVPHSGQGRIIPNYPPSDTDRAVMLTVPEGKTTYVTFKKEFTRPTAESDDLTTDFGVLSEWEQIIVVGAAARMSSYIDPTRLFVDTMVDAELNAVAPAGTATSLHRRLKSIRNELLTDAARRLRDEYPPVTTWADPFDPATRV